MRAMSSAQVKKKAVSKGKKTLGTVLLVIGIILLIVTVINLGAGFTSRSDYQTVSNGGEQGGLILKELHPVSGRQFRIEKATRLTIIGQLKEQADLVLPSTAVSRVHASIEQRVGNWYLKDMNSRNGTWVNEQELYGEEEQELINGDQIRFADLIYQVKI